MISTTLRRIVAAGVAALVLGGGVIGLAYAQGAPTTSTPAPTATPAYPTVVPAAPAQQTPSPAPAPGQQTRSEEHQRFLNALAARLGISTQQLEEAIAAARSDAGIPAESEGWHGHHHGGAALAAAAQAIGVTPQELRQELQGKSLAQVAQAHGKNPADVATAVKNAVNARIDQEVTNGELTADQAAQKKATADQAIDQDMTRVWPVEEQEPGSPGPRPSPATGATPWSTPMSTGGT
jgi:hypothetical protein